MPSGLWNKLTRLIAPGPAAPSTADRAAGWIEKSLDLTSQGRLSDALDAAAQAAGLEPDNPQACLVHVEALLALKRLDEADGVLADLRRRFPDEPDVFSASGFHARQARDYAAAVMYADKALSIRPRDSMDWSLRAWALFGLRRYDEAVTDSSRSLGLDRGNLVARSTLARALLMLHRYSEAEAEAEKLLRDSHMRPSALAVQGAVALSRGQHDDALAKLREATLDPQWCLELADQFLAVLLDLGQGTEAQAHVAEVASRGASAELVARLNAAVLRDQCRWGDALAVLSSVQLDPDSGGALSRDRALAMAATGECRDALRAIQAAESGIRFPSALQADLQLQLGLLDEARATVQGMLSLSPCLPGAWHRAVHIAWVEGNFDAAVAHGRQLVNCAPEDEHGHLQLLLSLSATGNVADTSAALENALQYVSAPDERACLCGIASAAAGETSKAVAHYDTTIGLLRGGSSAVRGVRKHHWEFWAALCHALRLATVPAAPTDRAAALHHLAQAFATGFWQKRLTWFHPGFRALRDDDQFCRMCEKV